MKRVLIVDDAIVARMVLKKILEQAGYEVVGEAVDGVEAVEKYDQLKPDIVTMDIVMPEMDGIEATAKITGSDPSASVVMTSTMHQKELSLKAIEAGASSYIVKPYEKDRILRTIEQILHDKDKDN
ncbi:MAG: response regulator [Candidatus Anammoxibacter sp.]